MMPSLLAYTALFVSCLALCLGLTLLLITRLPELLTPELKVRLLQIAAFYGIAFLICTAQWIFALLLIGFVSGWYGVYRRWIAEPSRLSLDEASFLLIGGGVFGILDALGWLNRFFGVTGRWLSHPTLSVGLIVIVMILAAKTALRAKSASNASER
jgi:hypothetical protein